MGYFYIYLIINTPIEGVNWTDSLNDTPKLLLVSYKFTWLFTKQIRKALRRLKRNCNCLIHIFNDLSEQGPKGNISTWRQHPHETERKLAESVQIVPSQSRTVNTPVIFLCLTNTTQCQYKLCKPPYQRRYIFIFFRPQEQTQGRRKNYSESVKGNDGFWITVNKHGKALTFTWTLR